MGTCPICSNTTHVAFSARALQKYPFNTVSCPQCGLLQVKNPHWLEEAYNDAIVVCDTGLVARNRYITQELSPLFYYLFGSQGTFVDYAGGTGLFVRLMRDAGFDFYWYDPYCTNVHARGFEMEKGKNYKILTAFEVIEHIQDPLDFLREALRETGAETIFFTTELFSGTPPNPDEWWYYAFDAGQHISFYQNKTLETMAEQLDMKLLSTGFLHVFCKSTMFNQLQKYYNWYLIRRYSRHKAVRSLQSKTMSDHRYLLGLTKVPT